MRASGPEPQSGISGIRIGRIPARKRSVTVPEGFAERDFASSPTRRSPEIVPISPFASRRIACHVLFSMMDPGRSFFCRMARSIRSGSSRMRSCGFPTPRIRLRRRSSSPPKKSITSPASRFPDVRNAIMRLLIVKSRRAASPLASTPSVCTSNWRCPGPVERSERASATSISSADQEADTL